MASDSIRIGTASWAIPRAVADAFPTTGTAIQRYTARFGVAEINSSFHRPHRRTTYERWAASVPEGFRFAVKMPKTVTHVAKLQACGPLLARFAEEVAGLGAKRGPMLVQLPPKLNFDPEVAGTFFDLAGDMLGGSIVCEPRHPSWFEAGADTLLIERRIARVAADPARVPAAAMPGGWPGLAYFRLHGSPRPYWSGYEDPALRDWADRAVACEGETWTIFDNTASGRAAQDALAFSAMLSG